MLLNKSMIDTFLQNLRFNKALPYIKGDVIDFGGNEGELAPYVTGEYTVVNYDHSVMDGKKADTIVSLAVIEHISFDDVHALFKRFVRDHLRPGGKIVVTTPAPSSKMPLEFMAMIGLISKENIDEHVHYWNKKELYELGEVNGLTVERFSMFGLNQFIVYSKNN